MRDLNAATSKALVARFASTPKSTFAMSGLVQARQELELLRSLGYWFSHRHELLRQTEPFLESLRSPAISVENGLWRLATRANFERLSPEQFLHLDEHEKPLNCGVTRYVGNPDLGSQGKLELHEYNRQYY